MSKWNPAAVASLVLILLVASGAGVEPTLSTDESVYVKGLGPDEHESVLYVWTRDGDGEYSDFLAVVDADPESETFGEVTFTAPTGSTRCRAG